MGTIVMWGTSASLPKIASLLWHEGHTVTLQRELVAPLPSADLYLSVVEERTAFNVCFPPDLPVLFWNQSEDAQRRRADRLPLPGGGAGHCRLAGGRLRRAVAGAHLTGWTTYARLARALTLDVLARPFIEAAVAAGVPNRRLLLRHVLPNISGPILATSFLRFGHTLLTIAGLSYLGIGVQPPTPDWGAMLAEAQPYMQRASLLLLAPALAIFVTALSVTLIGQTLIQRLDPLQRRTSE